MPYFCANCEPVLADVGRCWQVLQLAKAMEAQDFATVSKVQQESVPQTDNTSRRKIRGSSGSEKRGRQIVFFHNLTSIPRFF